MTKKSVKTRAGKKVVNKNMATVTLSEEGKSFIKTTKKGTVAGAMSKKRKLDDETVGYKKKRKVEKGGNKEIEDKHQKLEKKDLRILRRKKKRNYELSSSIIKMYDGLRR